MNPYAIPPLFACILITSIGLYIYLKGPKIKTNRIFNLFCLSLTIWLFGYIGMYQSSNALIALNWSKIGFTGITFIPITGFHFITTLIHYSPKKHLIALLYSSAILSLFFLWRTNYIYKSVTEYFWGFYPIAGPLYIIFLLMFIVLFAYGIILLQIELQKTRSNKQHQKSQQIKYVLIAFIGGTTGLVDYFVKYQIEIYPFGYISALFLIFIIAYAITKHQLMDIEIVIRKTAIYSILSAILTGILLSFIVLGEMFFRNAIGYNSIWAAILAIFVISGVFQPLREKIQRTIDKIFFKSKCDYRDILKRLNQTSSSAVDLNHLITIITKIITKTLKADKTSVLLREGNSFVLKELPKKDLR